MRSWIEVTIVCRQEGCSAEYKYRYPSTRPFSGPAWSRPKYCLKHQGSLARDRRKRAAIPPPPAPGRAIEQNFQG